ncbi:MAG: bifunctional lysylphosphatidylglycerol flippase/synthetase MprF [Gaiellaceae bacterium]
MSHGNRLQRWRFRVEQHELGPRVYFLGRRWHDWHLGLIVLGALVVNAVSGLVHAGFPALLIAFAGLWLIAKDWRDVTSRRRDTSAWRLGLHRHPHPLRAFHRADPLPVIAALACAAIAVADLDSALTPNVRWRGHLLTNVKAIQHLRVFHALAIPVAAVLLISAYYLYRRRRRALQLAIALLVALSIFNLLRGLAVEEAIGDFVVAGVLWWGRSSFYVEHEPIGRRAALLRAPFVALAGCLLSFVVVAVAAPDASVSMLVRETGDLLLWQPGPLSFHDEAGRLDLAVGLLGLATLVATAYLVFRPLAAPRDLPDPKARLLARELVREHGSDTLAYFKLRSDEHYLFSDDRGAFVGYRVEGGVLIISGEPVGPESALPELLSKVAGFAERRGLRIAAVGVSTKTRPVFEQLGLHGLYLGDEAIVETSSFSLDGRAIRKVRQSVSRLEKAGYSCLASPIADLGEETVVEVAEAATRWLGEAEERGFSMALDAGLAEHGETLVVLAHDADGRLRGLLHLVPTTAQRRGLSLSMMRRDPTAPNGLTEFMIVKAIESFRERGIEEISLNFAAFARLLHSPEGVAERFLRRLLQLADSFFQIERLYRFNDKFNPRWEARYLMHEGTLNLPRAALATLRVEGQLPRPHLPRRRKVQT